MPQGNPLGSPCASAGVQDKGDVVSRGFGGRGARGSIHQVNDALVAHFHREHWNLAVRSRSAHELRSYRRAKQNTRIGITEEKMKLLIGVCRIQRSSSSGDGCG